MTVIRSSDFAVLSVTYDGETVDRLTEYFNSIISQTIQPSEVVLCIDGQIRTELRKVIDDYKSVLKMRVINNEKMGLSKNLNIGLASISTKYTIRCDTDDIFLKHRFEQQVRHLKEKDIVLVSNAAVEIDGAKRRIKKNVSGYIRINAFTRFIKNPINHHSCAYVTDVIKRYGYPNGRMEDFRLWSKMLNDGHKMYLCSDVTTIVSASDLHVRRSGKDYRYAEIELLKENMRYNNMYAVLAFLLRWPLRFRAMMSCLKIAIYFTRKRENESNT